MKSLNKLQFIIFKLFFEIYKENYVNFIFIIIFNNKLTLIQINFILYLCNIFKFSNSINSSKNLIL